MSELQTIDKPAATAHAPVSEAAKAEPAPEPKAKAKKASEKPMPKALAKVKSASFTLNRAALDAALKAFKHVIAKRNTIPILGDVHIKADAGAPIQVIANNLDIELACAMPDVSKKAIDLTVSYDLLTRVVKAAKDAEFVTIKTDTTMVMPPQPKPAPQVAKPKGEGDEAKAEAEKPKKEPKPKPVPETKVTLYADDLEIEAVDLSRAEDFPLMPEPKKATARVSLDASVVFAALDKTEHCISTEDNRYYLNGVCFDARKEQSLRIVATDGHRLGMYDTETVPAAKYGEWDALVPRAVVSLLLHLLEHNEADKLHFVFAKAKDAPFVGHTIIGPFSVTFRLIDGTYPDYERVLPPKKQNYAVTINPDDLLKALGKIVTVGKNEKAVKLAPNGETIALEQGGHGDPKIRLTMPCKVKNSGVRGSAVPETGVNTRYLRTIADLIEGETISIAYDDPGSPMRITDPGDPRLTYVLMPMRV